MSQGASIEDERRVFERLVLKRCEEITLLFQQPLYLPWRKRLVEARGTSSSSKTLSGSKAAISERRASRIPVGFAVGEQGGRVETASTRSALSQSPIGDASDFARSTFAASCIWCVSACAANLTVAPKKLNTPVTEGCCLLRGTVPNLGLVTS